MSRELSPEEERLMQELRQELQNAPISVQQMLFVLGMEMMLAIAALKNGGELRISRDDTDTYARLFGENPLRWSMENKRSLVEKVNEGSEVVIRPAMPDLADKRQAH